MKVVCVNINEKKGPCDMYMDRSPTNGDWDTTLDFASPAKVQCADLKAIMVRGCGVLGCVNINEKKRLYIM